MKESWWKQPFRLIVAGCVAITVAWFLHLGAVGTFLTLLFTMLVTSGTIGEALHRSWPILLYSLLGWVVGTLSVVLLMPLHVADPWIYWPVMGVIVVLSAWVLPGHPAGHYTFVIAAVMLLMYEQGAPQWFTLVYPICYIALALALNIATAFLVFPQTTTKKIEADRLKILLDELKTIINVQEE